MARVLEHALQHVQLAPQGNEEQVSVFMAAADDIRRLLHQFAAGFLKSPALKCWMPCARFWKQSQQHVVARLRRFDGGFWPEPQGLEAASLCGGRAARRSGHACCSAGASSGRPSGSRRCARAIGGQARCGIPGGTGWTTTLTLWTSLIPTCSRFSRKRLPNCCPNWVAHCASGQPVQTIWVPAAKSCVPCTPSKVARFGRRHAPG